MKVLFVDDDPRLRAGWEHLFRDEEDMELVATLDCADDLVSAVSEHSADIVVLDLNMPGRDPLDAVLELATAAPEVRVVVYSGSVDPDTVQRAVDAGAWGFVDKLDDPRNIINAFRRVHEGQVVLPPGDA